MKRLVYSFVIITFLFVSNISAQILSSTHYSAYGDPYVFYANTGLLLHTDPRILGFGNIISVSSPYYIGSSPHLNPALLARGSKYIEGSLSFRPLKGKRGEIENITNFSAFVGFDSLNAVSVNFTSLNVDVPDFYHHSLDKRFLNVKYAHKFGKYLSLGTGLKIFQFYWSKNPYEPGKKVYNLAVDLGLNYDRSFQINPNFVLNWSVGTAIVNFGPKQKGNIFYLSPPKNFLPANLMLGNLLEGVIKMNEKYKLNIGIAYQVDKYLVPSQPYYYSGIGPAHYLSFKPISVPNISPFRALYESFYDSPEGFKGELKEINHAVGIEARVDGENFYLAGRYGHYGLFPKNSFYSTRGLGFGFGLYGTYSNIFWTDRDYWGVSFGFRNKIGGKLFRF